MTTFTPYNNGLVAGLGIPETSDNKTPGAVEYWNGQTAGTNPDSGQNYWTELAKGWAQVDHLLPYGTGFVAGLDDGAVKYWDGTTWNDLKGSNGAATETMLGYGTGFVVGFGDGSVQQWQPWGSAAASP